MIRRVVGIYFSPVGGTAKMIRSLTGELAEILNDCNPDGVTSETVDLIRMGDEELELDDETIAVIGMPVYVGKVPLPALKALGRVRAGGAVAAIAVSYGGRTYGNALYELLHWTEQLGFRVVGAGAFAVKYKNHNPEGLPEDNKVDADAVRAFGGAAAAKIRRLAGCEIEGLRIRPAPVEAPGRLPVHRISRISPKAAAVAQEVIEIVSLRHKDSEWYL